MSDAVPSEVEVKLEAPSADALQHLAGLQQLGSYRLRRRRTQQLRTTYFDTRDFALARAGLALRVRQHGKAWEATAKWSGRVSGSLHERPELTVKLGGPPTLPFVLPDGPLRLHVGPFVLGRPLAPILITDIERRLSDVLSPDGDQAALVAELALDTVVVHAPDGRAAALPYYEVEVERRDGTQQELTALSALLQADFGLIPSRAAKFVRGLSAVYGASAPAFAIRPTVRIDDSVARAARAVVARQLARLRACDPNTRIGRDPEALHDMRVAVRRLRAAGRAFASALAQRTHAVLTHELEWLGEVLGAARDLDVQLAILTAHQQRLSGEHSRQLDGFRRHLERERANRRAALLAALDSRRYQRLLLLLERFATSAVPARPRGEAAASVARVGRRAIKKALRRLTARGEEIGELPDAADLHALRLRAKRLRYLLESLRSITGAPGRGLAKHLARLQDLLGRFNDAMVAAAWIRGYRDAHAGDDAAVQRTLTGLADAELRRAGAAQSEFHRAWKRFAGKRTRRKARDLLAGLKTAARAERRRRTGQTPAAVPRQA